MLSNDSSGICIDSICKPTVIRKLAITTEEMVIFKELLKFKTKPVTRIQNAIPFFAILFSESHRLEYVFSSRPQTVTSREHPPKVYVDARIVKKTNETLSLTVHRRVKRVAVRLVVRPVQYVRTPFVLPSINLNSATNLGSRFEKKIYYFF